MSQDDILKALDLLGYKHGDVIELRAFGVEHRGRRTIASGYYNDFDKLAKDATAIDRKAAGIYITLNTVNPAFLSRRANRMQIGGDMKTTEAKEITRRTRLLIDVDAGTPGSGISSTDDEHQAAIERGRDIRTWLRSLGWSGSIFNDSGNGSQIIYNVDLPNDEESEALVRKCIGAIDLIKSDERAHVDITVFDPSRVFKLPGTWVCKGDDTDERPYRRSQVLEADEDRAVVPKEKLQEMAALYDEIGPKDTKGPDKGGDYNGPKIDLGELLSKMGCRIIHTKRDTGRNVHKLDRCERSRNHDGAFIIEYDNGWVRYGCPHNSCGGFKNDRTKELLDQYIPGWKSNPVLDEKLKKAQEYTRQRDAAEIKAQTEREFNQVPSPTKDGWLLYTLKDAYAKRPPVEYAVEGILSVPSLTVMFGAPSSLKTMLQMDLAVCIASGKKWLSSLSPEITPLETNKMPVLWVDEDGGYRRTSDRFKMLGHGHNVPVDTPLGYYSMPSPGLDASDPESMANLRDRIKALKSKVVFIDCLVDISGDVDENSAGMGMVMNNLRQLSEQSDAAVIVTHHNRKNTNAKNDTARAGESLRGSSAIEGALDLALSIERDHNIVTVTPTKTRDIEFKPFAAEFKFSDATDLKTNEVSRIAYFAGVPIDEGSRSTERSVKLAIFDAINRDGPTIKGKLVDRVQAMIKRSGGRSGRDYITHSIDAMIANNELSEETQKKGAKRISLT